MTNLKRQKDTISLESLNKLAYNLELDQPFPKRSIPVQVGVRSPSLIRFEPSNLFYCLYSVLLRFTPIFREKLGKALTSFTRVYSLKRALNLALSIPFFKHFSINQNKINKHVFCGGNYGSTKTA